MKTSIASASLAALVFVAGCGLVAPPPAAPARTAAAPATKATESPPQAAPGPSAREPAAPKVAEAPAAAAAKAPPKATTPPTKSTAPTTPAPVAAKPSAPVAAKPSAPPLDLRSLEERLKETPAIGVLTKLSLKNQVDDLIARFKAFHGGQRPPTLTELRPAYELLLMKVLSLLQDHDAKLANDINASRDAIWGVLTDRQKLAQFL